MAEPIRDRQAMIAAMDPRLCRQRVAFVTDRHDLFEQAIATFREAEGLSLVVPADLAPDEPPMAMITLQVLSALEGVGLTAAVASRLADHGIACNMVAAFHHDHLFVPDADGERALALLRGLQAEGTS